MPGLTDSEEDLTALRVWQDPSDPETVEVLPYHTLGTFKWEKLGIPYSLEGTPVPTKEQVAQAEAILEVNKYQ